MTTYSGETGTLSAGKGSKAPGTPTTLRYQNGKVTVTDGSFAETKEQLGGILILEAKDLNHAIQLMSRHPDVKAGPFEIRPAEDLSVLVTESARCRLV